MNFHRCPPLSAVVRCCPLLSAAVPRRPLYRPPTDRPPGLPTSRPPDLPTFRPVGGIPSSKTARFEDGRPNNDLPSSKMASSEDGKAERRMGFCRASFFFCERGKNPEPPSPMRAPAGGSTHGKPFAALHPSQSGFGLLPFTWPRAAMAFPPVPTPAGVRQRRDARSSRMRRLKTVCPARDDAENLIVWPRAGRFIYAILFASRKQRIQPKSGRDRHQAAHPSFSRPPPRRSTTDESRSPRRNTATRCLVMLGMRPEGVILSRKHAADDPRRECDGDKERPDYYAFFCAATDAADGQRLM